MQTARLYNMTDDSGVRAMLKFNLARDTVHPKRATGSDHVTVDLGGTHPLARSDDPTLEVTPVESARHVRTVPPTPTDHPVLIRIG